MEDSTDLNGRVAVVTGGTSGIGLGVCVAFAKLGCKVAFTGRSAEKGKKAVASIKEQAGCKDDVLLFIQGDVGEEKNVVDMFEKVVSSFGRVDLLINNAGISPGFFTIDELDSSTFDDVMKINVYGTFYCMKYGAKQMKSQGPPSKGVYSIINMSSVLGTLGWGGAAAYCTSKHAAVGLTRCAAKELAKDGIRVNSICPGVVESDMTSWMDDPAVSAKIYESQVIGRMGKVDEIAKAVVFACTTPFMMGHQLVLDGGWSGY